MMRRKGRRWLPATVLVVIPYLLFGRYAFAAVAGDIVEIQWGGHPTKARIDHCRSEGCDLFLWDANSAKWSDGTLWVATREIRGLKGTISAPTETSAVARSPLAQEAASTPVESAYKVGDRIECNVTGRWQPGTIVKAQPGGGGELFYLVNTDGEAATWDRWASSSQIRARTGLISETTRAHNELTALGALTAPKAGSLEETFQGLIRERYELQGSKEFPVTVIFQGFVIGRTHTYGRADVYGESPDGPGGTSSTIVYPVSAQYVHRHAYRDAFLSYQQDEIYQCFKNAFSKWQCNPASGGKGMVNKFREERVS